MSDIVNSLVLMFQQGGDLPRWPMANGTAQLNTAQTQREIAD
jgi:hypothetical protein